jgi:hypothetical protein
MVVNAAGLADFPTNGHALEDFVLEDEIAGVVALRKIAVFVERFGAHRVVDDVVLNTLEGEVALADGSETFHPIRDGELFRSDVSCHGSLRFTCACKAGYKAILRKRGLPQNYSAISGGGAAGGLGAAC